MAIEASGKVHKLFDTVNVSEKFSKREIVIALADNPKYPQLVIFQATGDRIAQLDDIREGDDVRVEFSLRGREWKKPGTSEIKYFNSLDVWKIEIAAPPSGQRRQSPPRNPPPPSGDAGNGAGSGDDDIPFATCSLTAEPSPIAPALRRHT